MRTRLPTTGEAVRELDGLEDAMLRCMAEHEIPGAALAVTRHGRLVYARGFGWADLQALEPVRPESLFRIASVSKPVTAVAILRLVQEGWLRLEDRVVNLLNISRHSFGAVEADPRLEEVTVLQLLQHTGGWDRARSGDPMFFSAEIAEALDIASPPGPWDIIRWMHGRPLDFTPGQEYAYSNYGYCLLGRIIEAVMGCRYEDYVRTEILAPLGIHTMRIGQTRARACDEVVYYPLTRLSRSVFAETLGLCVPHPYGAWYLEAMDSHGGWIASALDIVRFATAFWDRDASPLLTRSSFETMFARPPAPVGCDEEGELRRSYYGCGWAVDLPDETGRVGQQHHNGMLMGTATVMRRREDGICWTALFNAALGRNETYLGSPIVAGMDEALASITDWPVGSLSF
jgi:N-acyl-D-amino-acid deacylase